MRWLLPAIFAVLVRLRTTTFRAHFYLIAATLLTTLVHGCAAPLPLAVSTRPAASDPLAPTPRVNYRSTISPYVNARPIEPAPWQQQNQQVAPSSAPAK